MNLTDKLDRLLKKSRTPDALPLDSLAPMSKNEVRKLQESAVRKVLKRRGLPDQEIEAYIKGENRPAA